MKLPIKKKYFDLIKSGEKIVEYRDAHITFICEETKEELVCDVTSASITDEIRDIYPDVLSDENTLCFRIKKRTD